MRLIIDYKFAILSAITWILFCSLIINNLIDLKTISFFKNEINILKRTSGAYGKYSFDINAMSKDSMMFSRSYKNIALSNLFNDFKNVNTAKKVWITVSETEINPYTYKLYDITYQQPSWLRILLQMISYVINNNTLVIGLMLIITLAFCTEEFKKKYHIKNRLHGASINFGYATIAIIIAIIAIY